MVIAINYMREISNVFEKADCINVYTEGEVKSYKSGTDEFKGIITCWYEMIEGAYDMPAFGVSLHDETLEAMKSGRWIEFEFDNKQEHNGMSFEKLLIQVESGFKGFNLIRYNAEMGYYGRCFYFNLVNNDMSRLSDYLTVLGKK
ncbi:MAG: hypothetical protein J1G07_03165 [Clostridiales bacterium]|nr:hypothetical protein [Clostridiales bacterium]